MSETKTLVRVLNEKQALVNELIESGGEISEALEFALDITEQALVQKVDGYFFVIDAFESKEKQLKELADELYDAAKMCKNESQRIKDHVKNRMRELEVKELQGGMRRFTLSTGKASVSVDEALLPAQYTKESIVVSADKDLIKKALDEGLDVPGARLMETWVLKSTVNKKGSK